MAKAKAEPLAEGFIERFFACVPERGMPEVMAEPDRLGQILVQAQRPGDAA